MAMFPQVFSVANVPPQEQSVLTAGPINIQRSLDAYAYGFDINGGNGNFFRGGAAQKSYLLSVRGDRTDDAATGDSNDALVKASMSNYAANDANFIARAFNGAVTNRSGGVLGIIEGITTDAQNKPGGTVTTLHGAQSTAENYGAATNIRGAQVLVKNEGTGVTEETGILIDNENAGSGGAPRTCGVPIRIKSGGAQSTGYESLIDASTATIKPTGTVTKLFVFKDSANATKTVQYDSGTGLITVV